MAQETLFDVSWAFVCLALPSFIHCFPLLPSLLHLPVRLVVVVPFGLVAVLAIVLPFCSCTPSHPASSLLTVVCSGPGLVAVSAWS